MLLNRNKILMMAVMGAIANIPSDTTAQTFYQCMPKKCPVGQVLASDGNCKSTDSKDNWTLLYNYSDGQGEAKLDAGTYVVVMRGGEGCRGNGYNNLGGLVAYQFTVDKNWTFKYGVGDGNDSSGGGSWISIDDQYIVAGGGGGCSDWRKKGGVGGAVGAGSSDIPSIYGDGSYEAPQPGGSSGNYTCSKLHKNLKGNGYAPCISGEGINDRNAGRCEIIPTGNDGEYEVRALPGTTAGLKLYPGYVTTEVGGTSGYSGSATHKSNVSSSNPFNYYRECKGMKECGFVRLYKFI